MHNAKKARSRLRTGFFSHPVLLGATLFVGVQGLLVTVLVRMVQGSFFGVLLRVGSETVGGVAVVSGLFVVALFEVFHGGAVVLHRVLEVVGGLLVGLHDFLMFLRIVSHRGKGEKGKKKWFG